jgi:hypothetical protein
VDEQVVTAFFTMMERRYAAAPQPRDRARTRRVKEAALFDRHGAALLRLGNDYYIHQLISREEYIAMREALDTKLGVRRRQAVGDRIPGYPTVERLRPAWPTLAVGEQREILKHAIARVLVRPVGGGRYNPDRVTIRWWTDAEQANDRVPQTRPANEPIAWLTEGQAAARS